jgi:hypothetical protein
MSEASMLQALDRVTAAADADDGRRFAEASRKFLREFRAHTDARGLADVRPMPRLLAFQNELLRGGQLDRAATVATIRDVIREAREERAWDDRPLL